jgi:hypothetical protein
MNPTCRRLRRRNEIQKQKSALGVAARERNRLARASDCGTWRRVFTMILVGHSDGRHTGTRVGRLARLRVGAGGARGAGKDDVGDAMKNMYADCSVCGLPGNKLRLVEDADGTMASYSEPGMVFLICPACGRHARPENWNQVNGGEPGGKVE